MLQLRSLFVFTIVATLGLWACQNTGKTDESENNANQIMESSPVSETSGDQAKLRHVVLFKFKDGADPEAVEKAIAAFEALPGKIPQIRDFEWGTNNSPEGLNKGLTHCFLLTFHSEEDRDIYLPHPNHKAFGALLGDILEDVTVVDYWTD